MSVKKTRQATIFRIKFNNYQHAYFTTIAKRYRFCLNLLAEWLYDYIKNAMNDKLLDKVDYNFRRFKYAECIRDFPQKLFETVYRQLPSAIAQNIFPEALALAKSRVNKPQAEYHFRVESFSFTWTNVPQTRELVLPRSPYLKQFFKDPVRLTIPQKVWEYIKEVGKRFTLRIIFEDGAWYAHVIIQPKQKPERIPKERKFAGIDLNLGDIAYIDEVRRQPVLFSLRQTTYKAVKWLERADKLQSQGDEHYKYYHHKISQTYRNVFKLYAVRIVQYAKQIGITRIAYGDVDHAVKRGRLNKRLRRLWNKVPWNCFTSFLESYARKYGIHVYSVSEAYTSKCSALRDDIIVNPRQPSGKRVTRGLYKDGDVVINSDVNAAANILKKAAYNFGKIVKFTKDQLSAVRRVGVQILTSANLITALFRKKLKDYLSGAGYLDGSHSTKRSYCCLSLWDLVSGNTAFPG